VAFAVVIGNQRRGVVKVDLITGCAPIGELEKVPPAHSLDVKGIKPCVYRLYPIADTVADKVCATLVHYPGGRRSSRVKDLVDLVAIALGNPIDGPTLKAAIASERHRRGLKDVTGFSIPGEWKAGASLVAYVKGCREAGVPEPYLGVATGEELVKHLVDPLLGDYPAPRRWNPGQRDWEP
jgi:hypothetical protein